MFFFSTLEIIGSEIFHKNIYFSEGWIKLSYLIALITLITLIGDVVNHFSNYYDLKVKVTELEGFKIDPEVYLESNKDNKF